MTAWNKHFKLMENLEAGSQILEALPEMAAEAENLDEQERLLAEIRETEQALDSMSAELDALEAELLA